MSMFSTSSHQLPCDVLCSRLSPNRSRQLVGYGGRDCAVHVFPFAGHSSVARLEGLTAPVTAIAFSSDQTSLVAGSDAGGLRLWDLATEKSIRVFYKGHTATVTDIDVHKSGHFVASVSMDNNLRIWDTRKSSALQSYKDAKTQLCAVQFAPNGQWVAAGDACGVVRIYNLRSAKLEAKLTLHTSAITSINFHPEMYFMAVGSGDSTISVWNLENFHDQFHSTPAGTPIDNVQFCGSRLLAAADHCLRVYDPQQLSDHTASVYEAPWTVVGDLAYVAFSDEAWFVECCGSTATTGRLRLGQPQQQCGPSSTDDNSPQSSPGIAPPLSVPAHRQPQATPTTRATVTNANTAAPKRAAPAPAPPSPPPQAQQQEQQTQRIQPTLPRPQRMAAQENYVVEKPRVTSETPFIVGGNNKTNDMTFTPSLGGSPPGAPEVPFVDETGAELDVVEQLISTSTTMTSAMHNRLTHLRVVRTLWAQDQRAALEHLRKVCGKGNKAGVVYDFLTAMQQQRMKEKMTMEALPDLLDILQWALGSTYDPLLLVTVRTLRSMNTKFRARVDEAQRRHRLAQSNGHNDPLGVNNAGGCAERFGACGMGVLALTARRDAIGDEARYLTAELPPPLR